MNSTQNKFDQSQNEMHRTNQTNQDEFNKSNLLQLD